MALCLCHNDKKANLSISYDPGSKRTLIYCYKGCYIKDILGWAGLKMNDIFEEEASKKTRQDRIEALYKYTDEGGILLLEKIRFKPKAFTKRRYIDGSVVIRSWLR